MSGPTKAQGGVAQVELRGDPEDLIGLVQSSLDPNLTYRWVRDDTQSTARRVSQGYKFVAENEVETLVELGKSADGRVRHADSVLMACDSRLVSRRRVEYRGQADKRLKSPETDFRTKASGQSFMGRAVQVIGDERSAGHDD